jgi:hypothetical protein
MPSRDVAGGSAHLVLTNKAYVQARSSVMMIGLFYA